MTRVIIIYYSRTGNTRKMAEAVAEGCSAAGAEAVVREAARVKPEELLSCDAVIIGSPTYYGSMAAEVKKLLDDSVSLHGRLEGKVGAAFASSANVGGGNETTILDILNAFLVHGMIVRGDSQGDHYGPVAIGSPDQRTLKACSRLGARAVELAKKLHP